MRVLQASASLSDLYGCVLMTLSVDDQVAAMTLIHECQHSKLNGLLDLLPLVATDSPDRFYAPWRDDLPPAIGLLHGVYAHVGIAGFWQPSHTRRSGVVDSPRSAAINLGLSREIGRRAS